MGELRVLTDHGDETLTWDPEDKKATAKAKAEFDRLASEGYLFYESVETKGQRVSEFDPKLGKIIAAPGGKTASDREKGTRPRAMAGGPTAQTARL